MGLYQLELSRQLHLRNKQKREWEMMKKKIEKNNANKETELSKEQEMIEQEQREEELTEIRETNVSKKLATEMVRSARENDAETLKKAVDVLQNQNGNFYACLSALFIIIYHRNCF